MVGAQTARDPPAAHDGPKSEAGPADVTIVAADGKRLAAHSAVLGSASPVLESLLLDGPRRGEEIIEIPILGVPCGAVDTFIRCLYTSRWLEGEETTEFKVHLLVLSHVLRVAWLKRAAEEALVVDLTVENVIDMLQLARQCDAPRLHVMCMRLLRREHKAVEKTEGWKFVQANDPWLELELLQFLQEMDKMEKRRMRRRREQRLYMELSEAMESLQHICVEGCTHVGPRDEDREHGTCKWGHTCEGMQRLIRHFAACSRKTKRGCRRCASVWQLLRLHAAVCDDLQAPTCKVPLCKQFKEKMGMGMSGGVEGDKWALLARKVVSAKIVSSLSKIH